MGNTLLQSTQLYSTGKYLLESFEFPTWLTDQAWTITHGTPVNSSVVAKDGVYSFPMDASYPSVSKVFPASCGFCVVYFYDDATQTASTFKPGILWNLANTVVIGVGVSNATSTGFYTLWNNGVLSATAVARTTGWHRFMFQNISGDVISIDGTVVLNSNISPMVSINTLGSITTSGTPFGYFDYVQAASTYFVNLVQKNPGQPPTNVALMLPAAAPGAVDTQLAHDTPTQSGLLDVSAQDMPISGYFTAFAPSVFQPLQAPYLTSDVFASIFAGDVYNVLAVDLGRKVISFDPGDMVNRVDSQSVSGKNEAIIFNNRDMPSISISDLPNQLRLDLEAWWSWAKLSQSFSLAIDSGWTFWGQMSAVSGTNVVTLVNATGCVPGEELRLRHYDNSYSERKKISQVIGNQVTFTKNLERSYGIGDIAVAGLYWPRLIATNKKYPITLTEPRTKRWSFSLAAMENL